MFRTAALALLVLAAAAVLLPLTSAFSDPINVDSPESPEFDDTGAWDPAGNLLGVAMQTLGTAESCVANGGKPFYQMQKGLNDRDEAIAMAPAWTGLSRTAWCSETIAYWHREAGTPFPGGYSCDWNPGWQITNTTGLRNWYQTAEDLGPTEGRGRWISGGDLDYADYQPGVNGPAPGAYQQLMGWDEEDGWSGPLDAHSQMVQSVVVHRDVDGQIVSIDVQVIEGNVGSGLVRNTKTYEDVLRYTTAGPEKLGSRKIRGWGVDLQQIGPGNVRPVIDLRKIEYLDDPKRFRPVKRFPPIPDPIGPVVKDWVRFARAVRSTPISVTAGGTKVQGVEGGLPDPARNRVWSIPKSERPVTLTVTLPAAYPWPVKGVGLTFTGGAYPTQLSVAMGASADRMGPERLVRMGASRQGKAPAQVTFEVAGPRGQRGVRTLRVTIPAGAATRAYTVGAFHLIPDYGPEDSDRNP